MKGFDNETERQRYSIIPVIFSLNTRYCQPVLERLCLLETVRITTGSGLSMLFRYNINHTVSSLFLSRCCA